MRCCILLQDVVEKLKELARGYHRSLCILAASGTLSAATLAQIGPTGHGVGVTLRVSAAGGPFDCWLMHCWIMH
jgi:hypothetical protein